MDDEYTSRGVNCLKCSTDLWRHRFRRGNWGGWECVECRRAKSRAYWKKSSHGKVCEKCGGTEWRYRPDYKQVLGSSGNWVCKSCMGVERQQIVLEKKRKTSLKQIAADRKYRAAHLERHIWSETRSRATRNDVPFSITVADVVIPERCPVLGCSIWRDGGTRRDTSPSIDRLIPKLGYIPGNVFVVSWRANRIKNDGTADEHERIAIWMRKMTQVQVNSEFIGRV